MAYIKFDALGLTYSNNFNMQGMHEKALTLLFLKLPILKQPLSVR